MFFSWLSVNAFNAWHDLAKQALGIPHPNHNQATGKIDESAQWTTAYTEPITVSEYDVRAYVKQSVAELVPDGLGVPSEPPPAPDFPDLPNP